MGCFGCLKYILVIFSVLYIFIGLGLIAVSLWMHLDYLKDESSFDPGTDYFDIALYVAMGIGGFLVLMGIMGCVGALRISLCLLGNFAVMVVAAIGGLIAVAVLAYVYKDEVMKMADRFVQDLIMVYGNTQSGTKSRAMDFIQHAVRCCGASSPYDWLNVQNSRGIPISCCRNPANCNSGGNFIGANGLPNLGQMDFNNNFIPSNAVQQMMATEIFPQGCADKFRNTYAQAMQILVGLSGGIAGFMLIGFIFCVAFCCVI